MVVYCWLMKYLALVIVFFSLQVSADDIFFDIFDLKIGKYWCDVKRFYHVYNDEYDKVKYVKEDWPSPLIIEIQNRDVDEKLMIRVTSDNPDGSGLYKDNFYPLEGHHKRRTIGISFEARNIIRLHREEDAFTIFRASEYNEEVMAGNCREL